MIPLEETTLRLLLGVLLGGIIGFEREIHGRPAGFRTQLIVCVAAVLIMIISENYYYKLERSDPSFQIDPARFAASALIGIGFLGAGVIIKSGSTVHGLTTAASIWIVSAIGIAIGGGFYIEAVITTLITVITLVILRKLEDRFRILVYKTVTVTTKITGDAEATLTGLLTGSGIHIQSIDYEKDADKNQLIYQFTISTREKGMIQELFLKIGELDFVKQVKIGSGEKLLFENALKR